MPPATMPLDNPWQFKSENTAPNQAFNSTAEPDTPTQSTASQSEGLDWTAAEFVAHDKSAGWYTVLGLAAVIAAIVIYILTKDRISTAIVIIAAVALGIFASRKPKEQLYGLNADGILIGRKAYGFQDFKTFAVAEDGAVASVVFMPLKRFMPPLTIYVPPELEDQVVGFLSAFLPLEQHKADAVDNLLRRIRF